MRFRRSHVLAAGSSLAWLVAACSLLSGGSAAPLSYSNGTSIPIDLVVNGSRVTTIAPNTGGELAVSVLPPLPWNVTAQTASGRVLTSMVVKAGDVIYTDKEPKGDALRVDLSCGRLDIWSGPPLLGPIPGPGKPGDCNP